MGCGLSRVSPDFESVSQRSFEIERVIGQGGFGRVNAVVKCRGYDKGTWYAMKTLSKKVILERNHVAMVIKERNLLAKLHCPQLVNMHYAFQDDLHLFIVMDVCLGGDLHYQLQNIAGKCFSETQARFYAASLIVCLEYMHSVGTIHRDIKPENLLLDSRGQLKVTDLGISQELVDGVCTSTSGTRPYMAPEIFVSGHRHTTVADIYSLGITVYQFLVGSRPYRPDTVNMKAIVRMSAFVPPERYMDLKQIRRILIYAQERKAPSTEFQLSRRLKNFSSNARDFIQSCLICNPKYRLGALGISELMDHPWFEGVNWDAMRKQEISAPFIPDVRQANCSISRADIEAMQLAEEEAAAGPPIPDSEQLKFLGYDYRTRAMDKDSGRNERIARPALPDSSPDADATVSAAPTEDDSRGSKSVSVPSENAKKQLTSPPSLDPGVATAASSSQSVSITTRPLDGLSPPSVSTVSPPRNDAVQATASPPTISTWIGRGVNDANENAALNDAAPERSSKAPRGVPVLPSPLTPLTAAPVSLVASVPLVGHSEFVTNSRSDSQKSGRDPVYSLPSSARDTVLPGSPLRQQSVWRNPQRRDVADMQQQPSQLPGALDDIDTPVRPARDQENGDNSVLPAPLPVQPSTTAWNRSDGLPAPVVHNAAFLMHFAPAAGRLPY